MGKQKFPAVCFTSWWVKLFLLSTYTFTLVASVFLFYNSQGMCSMPPAPHSNGGLYTWPVTQLPPAPYGHQIIYSCDEGRKLERINTTNGMITQVNTQILTCEWDETWTPSQVSS